MVIWPPHLCGLVAMSTGTPSQEEFSGRPVVGFSADDAAALERLPLQYITGTEPPADKSAASYPISWLIPMDGGEVDLSEVQSRHRELSDEVLQAILRNRDTTPMAIRSRLIASIELSRRGIL